MMPDQIRSGVHDSPRSRARRGQRPVPGAQSARPSGSAKDALARFGSIPPSRIDRAWAALTDEAGSITQAAMIGFLILCAVAGIALGKMML